MIRSMTGFGRAQRIINGVNITVEIRSVNHRYFDFSVRSTKGYGFLEEKAKQYIQGKVARGKIDVYIGIESIDTKNVQVLVNESLVGEYVQALKQVAKLSGIEENITLSSVLRCPELFTFQMQPEDEEALYADVREVLKEALNVLLAMKETEGQKLKEDVENRVAYLLKQVEIVETRSPQTVKEYETKLLSRIREAIGNVQIDEQRILTEAAIYADKVAVSEETVRLRSHFDQITDMMSSSQPTGKKLDFIIQEVNREINTIGSKAQDLTIGKIVIDMKAEVEKIREQIQNIE